MASRPTIYGKKLSGNVFGGYIGSQSIECINMVVVVQSVRQISVRIVQDAYRRENAILVKVCRRTSTCLRTEPRNTYLSHVSSYVTRYNEPRLSNMARSYLQKCNIYRVPYQ